MPEYSVGPHGSATRAWTAACADCQLLNGQNFSTLSLENVLRHVLFAKVPIEGVQVLNVPSVQPEGLGGHKNVDSKGLTRSLQKKRGSRGSRVKELRFVKCMVWVLYGTSLVQYRTSSYNKQHCMNQLRNHI